MIRYVVIVIFFYYYGFNQVITIDDVGGKMGPEEPTICISPINPNIQIAAANINRLYRSEDGGEKWVPVDIQSSYGIYGDPCIIADEFGTFYYFHLSDPDHRGWMSPRILDRIVCQVSTDNGKSWSDGTSIGLNHPKDQDKEWAIYNPITKEIGVSWTEFDEYGSKDSSCFSRILFSKASIFDMQWSKPLVVSKREGNCIDDSYTTEGAFPSYNKNGTFFVTWSMGDYIYIDSLKQKKFQKKDRILMPMKGGWDIKIPGVGRANGFPIMKVDTLKGWHFLNWCDTELGKSKVKFTWSSNNGLDWQAPIFLEPDTNTTEFFTWMDLDEVKREVHFIYYQIHKDSPDKINTIYLKYNLSNHTQWKRVLTDQPFDVPGNVFFGDYNNIDFCNGVIRPIWTEYKNEKLSIKTFIFNAN